MKGYTILLLLFLCPCFVSAQDLVVKGIVLDKNNYCCPLKLFEPKN